MNQLRASENLKQNKNAILDRWLSEVKIKVPAAKHHDRSALVNSLPIFLDHLVHALEERATDANFDNVIASQHGVQRADIGKFTADQIIDEYGLLHELILDALGDTRAIPAADAKLISISLHTAMLESVRAFISRIENKKQEVETEFKLLVQEVKDYAIFITDPNGIIMSWNEGAHRIKGFKAEEVIGSFYGVLYREEDYKAGRPQRNMEYALRDGRHEEQWWRRRKDGSWFWADATMTPVITPEGKHIGFSKVVRDLTSKKQADDELRAAKEAAEAANELKSAFLANMSHEIRTPLGAILGFAEALRDPTISHDERERFHGIIERNGKVLSRLIDDILDLSRVEAGKLEIQYVEVTLATLLSEVVGIAELKAKEKGLDIEFHMHQDIPNRIVSDPVRLRQILTNVLGNAVKFTDEGRVTVNLEYEKHIFTNSTLIIRVSDTGPGIAPEQRGRLFKPFAQADESRTRRFGGTGLGLALSRRLARELGGDLILLDCPAGEGCTFEIRVADRRSASRETPIERPGDPKKAVDNKSDADLSGCKILLVEDSRDNQTLIKRLLAKAGARVELADNGADGFDRAIDEEFDLVLMDMQMPVLDGIEATRKLRAHGFTKPVLALTAHAMQEQRQACLDAGCDDHLTKPIETASLLRLVSFWALKDRAAETKSTMPADMNA